jgi:hypothetical protein
MGSLTRAPKIHKPSKGVKNFLKQGVRGMKNALRKAVDPKNKVNWNNPKAARAHWLRGFLSDVKPHQSGKEKARRVRQMTEHKCIDPGSWNDKKLHLEFYGTK